jgi:SAM-dependent methyltransferase
MYRLGTSDIWWNMAKDNPEKLPAERHILKPLGHANVLEFIAHNDNIRSVLEIGHGARSMTFDEIHNRNECWGIDSYDREKTVPIPALESFRQKYPTATFVNGFVGSSSEKLPTQYFDLCYSVSVIEHVPEDQISAFHRDIFRVLKPGGYMLHSYDVWWGRDTRYMYDAIESAGFEWLESPEKMCVPWEPFLPELNPVMMNALLRKIAMEHPHIVHEVFAAQIPRAKRTTLNWVTILIGARKPI